MKTTVVGSSSRGNGYVLADGAGNQLLIEAGMSVREVRASGITLFRFDGCLVSHSHLDHSRKAFDYMRKGVECYMSIETANAIDLNDHRFLHIVENEVLFTVGPWKVLPFSTIHDCPGSLGFLIRASTGETVLFATDTAWIKYRPKGLDRIMVECNYQEGLLADNLEAGKASKRQADRLRSSHISLATLLRWLGTIDLSRVREIMLLHVSRRNAVEKELIEAVEGATGIRTVVAR